MQAILSAWSRSVTAQSDVIHRCDFFIVPFIYRLVSYRFCCYRMVLLNAVMPDLSNINYIHKYLKIKIHGHLQFKEFLLFTLTILYFFLSISFNLFYFFFWDSTTDLCFLWWLLSCVWLLLALKNVSKSYR